MSKAYTVMQFTGGMNDWVHPSLLDANTAKILVNAEESEGKIVPIRKPIRMTNGDPTAYGHYGTRDRSLVKWYDRFYWSNNTVVEAPFYGGNTENYLGIPYPSYSGTGVNVSITGSAPGDEETGLTGSYKYCVCFVNSNGWEGAPGSLEEYEISKSLEGEWGEITVTWSDSRISYAKVYRTGASGADFYCVGEIGMSGGSLTDKTDDTTLVFLNPLDSEDNYPPPDGGKYLSECGGVFFLAVGSLLYFSKHGNPHAWPTLQFLNFDDTITGIVPEFQGILVFTRNNVYRVIGAENPETVTKIYIPGNHGCVNFRSIGILNNAPVWLSNDGICLWDGSSIRIPSYGVLKTDALQVRYAVTANDRYYLFLVNGGIVFDRRNGEIFYKLDFTCEYAWYDGSSDVLYLKQSAGLYQYGVGGNLTFRYETGNIGESELRQKIFHEVLLSCDGKSELYVFVGGVEKVRIELPSGRRRVKLPLSAVGRYLSLRICSASRLNELSVIYE